MREKLTHEFVKNQYEIFGYKLLSKYENNYTKNLVKCPEGHQYDVRYNDFQQGKRCSVCVDNKKKLTYKQRKNLFEFNGYKLLTKEYKNSKTLLSIECPKGHQYNVSYNNFYQGHRCPICWELKKHSQSEKDCFDIVKQLTNENIIENDRSQIINYNTNRFLELDIWIPSLSKAIEFNGEYWHESNYSKFKDKQKEIQCKKKNIDLLIIWYEDWINDRENQITDLKDFLK